MTSSTGAPILGLDQDQTSTTQSLSVSAQAPLVAPAKTRRAATKRTESEPKSQDSASMDGPSSSGQGNCSKLLASLPSRIVAFDVEASGLVAKYDQITELAAVIMEDGEVDGTPFQSRIKLRATQKISLEVLGLQFGALEEWKSVGRALKALYDAPEPATVVSDFAAWAQIEEARHLPNVAWNASFDYGFYREMFGAFTNTLGGAILSPCWICAMDLFKHTFTDAKRANLNAACVALGVTKREEDQGHSALQDAILAGNCYFAIRKTLMERT